MDTETTGLDVWRGHRCFAIIFCDTRGRYLYVRLDERASDILLDQIASSKRAPDAPGEGQSQAWQAVNAADWRIEGDMPCPEGAWSLEAVKRLLESDRPKVFHNCKFDIRMIYWTFGWSVNNPIYDTMILARLMVPSMKRLGLKILSDEILKLPPTEEQEIGQWMRDNKNHFTREHNREPSYIDVPDDLMRKYAVGDVHRTILLFRRWWKSAHDKRWEIFQNEMELCFEIMRMEDVGMRVDLNYTKKTMIETERRIHQLDKEIWDAVGVQFNINSDAQCAKYLLTEEGLNLGSKITEEDWEDHERSLLTTKGAMSTSRNALKVYDKYDTTGTCKRLMLRNMLVGMDRYYKHFMENHYENSKGHTIMRPSILQHTASTGRFSIVDPPLQTIPSRSSGRLLDFERDAIPDVRRCFVPTYQSWPMYAFDYSQIELRLIAFYAQEETMIQAFAEGKDVHDTTTEVVWSGRENLEDPVVWKRCRTFCKMVNFGLAYGMQEEKFHQELNTPMDVVRRTIEIYNSEYPGISNLMEVVKDHVRRYGYLHTVFGRLQLPGRSKAYRGVNYLIQGTGADVLKYAMVNTGRWARSEGIPIIPILPIHDEIILQVHPSYDNRETLQELARVLEDFPQFDPLPIKVGCKRIVGHWSNKEDVDLAA